MLTKHVVLKLFRNINKKIKSRKQKTTWENGRQNCWQTWLFHNQHIGPIHRTSVSCVTWNNTDVMIRSIPQQCLIKGWISFKHKGNRNIINKTIVPARSHQRSQWSHSDASHCQWKTTGCTGQHRPYQHASPPPAYDRHRTTCACTSCKHRQNPDNNYMTTDPLCIIPIIEQQKSITTVYTRI